MIVQGVIHLNAPTTRRQPYRTNEEMVMKYFARNPTIGQTDSLKSADRELKKGLAYSPKGIRDTLLCVSFMVDHYLGEGHWDSPFFASVLTLQLPTPVILLFPNLQMLVFVTHICAYRLAKIIQ